MKKLFFAVTAALVLAGGITFLACNKDEENILNNNQRTRKSMETLNIDYYYSLGEGHNQILTKLHSMNIPGNANIIDVINLLTEKEGVYPNELLNIKPDNSSFFKEFGLIHSFSPVALSYCTNLDAFLYHISKQKPKDINEFINTIYLFTDESMQSIYKDFINDLLSATEREMLLVMFGVYAKSADYWIRYDAKNIIKILDQMNSKVAIDYEFLWLCAWVHAVAGSDSRNYNTCMSDHERIQKENSNITYPDPTEFCEKYSAFQSHQSNERFKEKYPKASTSFSDYIILWISFF